MTAQQLIVFSIVLLCSVYALWVLMPAAVRRLLATWLVRVPLGTSLKTFFQQAASRSGGCDCSGCDKVVDPQTKTRTKVIRIHAQPKD